MDTFSSILVSRSDTEEALLSLTSGDRVFSDGEAGDIWMAKDGVQKEAPLEILFNTHIFLYSNSGEMMLMQESGTRL